MDAYLYCRVPEKGEGEGWGSGGIFLGSHGLLFFFYCYVPDPRGLSRLQVKLCYWWLKSKQIVYKLLRGQKIRCLLSMEFRCILQTYCDVSRSSRKKFHLFCTTLSMQWENNCTIRNSCSLMCINEMFQIHVVRLYGFFKVTSCVYCQNPQYSVTSM